MNAFHSKNSTVSPAGLPLHCGLLFMGTPDESVGPGPPIGHSQGSASNRMIIIGRTCESASAISVTFSVSLCFRLSPLAHRHI